MDFIEYRRAIEVFSGDEVIMSRWEIKIENQKLESELKRRMEEFSQINRRTNFFSYLVSLSSLIVFSIALFFSKN